MLKTSCAKFLRHFTFSFPCSAIYVPASVKTSQMSHEICIQSGHFKQLLGSHFTQMLVSRITDIAYQVWKTSSVKCLSSNGFNPYAWFSQWSHILLRNAQKLF